MPELMDGSYISDQEDQEDYLGYDATHCEHGTFVGGWAGPDYMCHWCEDGVSLAEYQSLLHDYAERRRRYRRVQQVHAERIKRYLDLPGVGRSRNPALFDSIVRLTTWMFHREHWA